MLKKYKNELKNKLRGGIEAEYIEKPLGKI
jgi:hypothetical protein